jgi:hypothetical protein
MISTNCTHYVTYEMGCDVTQHQFLEEPAAYILSETVLPWELKEADSFE